MNANTFSKKISLTSWSSAGEESFLGASSHSIDITFGEKASDTHPPQTHMRIAHKSFDAEVKGAISPAGDTVLRILMVEDSNDDCDLICYQLKKCGYTPLVERAFCEESMRAALSRNCWNIVFTDHGLPGFSAFAAIALIRKMGVQIPIICITGTMDPVIIRQILAAGVCSCISKDDLSQLCNAVRRALNIV